MNTCSSGLNLHCDDGSIQFDGFGGVRAVGGGGTGTFRIVGEDHVESDVLISVAPPTAPNTFPAGQPEVLLEVVGETLGGRVLVQLSSSIFITNDDNTVETTPFVQLQLWIDGAQVAYSNATLSYQYVGDPPTTLDAIETFGGIQRLFPSAPAPPLPAGVHTFQVRWGVQGDGPAASAGIFAASGFDHASLLVTEV